MKIKEVLREVLEQLVDEIGSKEAQEILARVLDNPAVQEIIFEQVDFLLERNNR